MVPNSILWVCVSALCRMFVRVRACVRACMCVCVCLCAPDACVCMYPRARVRVRRGVPVLFKALTND